MPSSCAQHYPFLSIQLIGALLKQLHHYAENGHKTQRNEETNGTLTIKALEWDTTERMYVHSIAVAELASIDA
jgi:hypothetical protein